MTFRSFVVYVPASADAVPFFIVSIFILVIVSPLAKSLTEILSFGIVNVNEFVPLYSAVRPFRVIVRGF